jgi:hypothetical protein
VTHRVGTNTLNEDLVDDLLPCAATGTAKRKRGISDFLDARPDVWGYGLWGSVGWAGRSLLLEGLLLLCHLYSAEPCNSVTAVTLECDLSSLLSRLLLPRRERTCLIERGRCVGVLKALTSPSHPTIVPRMNAVKASRQFEEWLARRTTIVKKDLRLKHTRMRAEIFPFLRATYYRWARVWPEVCADLVRAPRVLAVGDLHVENFGTWRDRDGRLIWGVNDFDEAWPIPYANDLVRLAVSAHLACEAGRLPLKGGDICTAILEGYREGLREKGRPFVLEEDHKWLREIAESELRDPVRFWQKMDALRTTTEEVPVSAIEALEHLMPAPGIHYRIAHRVAGLGSLGHARYVAIGEWHGGQIAREEKALVASSCTWAQDDAVSPEILYQTVITRAVRCPDPFVQLRGRWIVRRLSPHCSRIELAMLGASGIELRLLRAMGWETANIHLGTPAARKPILRHLDKQKGKWLHTAASAMLAAVRSDWQVWRQKGYT